jgi:VWFA-related protein
MNRRSAIQRIFLASAASWCRELASAIPRPDEAGYTIHSDVRLVLLDVSVRDERGATVSELEQGNFQVVEDGRPQTITAFEKGDIPVTAGLLVDESRSMGPKRSEVLQAAEALIAASNPQDQFFVFNFNDTVRPGLPEGMPFSDRADELRAALYRGKAEGKTALNDAVVAGLHHLEMGRRGRKALVLISDGGDNASVQTQRTMMQTVEDSIATIYTIGLFDADDGDQNPGLLTRLARISGGRAYFPADSTGMLSVCQKIAKDIRSRYTIGYVPEAGPGRRELRHIQVRVSADHRRLRAHTRTSYRYETGGA